MKTMMIALCFSLVSAATFAADGKDSFADRKAKMISRLEERIQKMEEMKSCVSAASDKEALMACHGKMKDWRQGQTEERKEMRKARREKRKGQEEGEE